MADLEETDHFPTNVGNGKDTIDWEETVRSHVNSWSGFQVHSVSTTDINSSIELVGRMISANQFRSLALFVDLLDEVQMECLRKTESFRRALMSLWLSQGKFQEVIAMLKSETFSDSTDLLRLWDQAHYRQQESKLRKPLDALNRFRVRQRNPPPSGICPGGERPTHKLSEQARQVLRSWLARHQGQPYPSKAEKEQLGRETGLSASQIKTWFANSRRRLQHHQARAGTGRCHNSSEERPLEESQSEETGDEELTPAFEDISPVKGTKPLRYVCSERSSPPHAQNNLFELSRLCDRISTETGQQGSGCKQQAPATDLPAPKTLCETVASPSSVSPMPHGGAEFFPACTEGWKLRDVCMSSASPVSALSALSTRSPEWSGAHCSPISSVESSPRGSPGPSADRDAASTGTGYPVQPPPGHPQSMRSPSSPSRQLPLHSPMFLQTMDLSPCHTHPALKEGRTVTMHGFVEAEATTTTTRWRHRLGVHDGMTAVLGSPGMDVFPLPSCPPLPFALPPYPLPPFPLPPFPSLPTYDPLPPFLDMPLTGRRHMVVDSRDFPALMYRLQQHTTQLPLDLSHSRPQAEMASSLEESRQSPLPESVYHTLTPLSLPACPSPSHYPDSRITTAPLTLTLERQAGLSRLARDTRPSLLHPGVMARPFPGSAVSGDADRFREQSAGKEDARRCQSRRRRSKAMKDDSKLPELQRSPPSRPVEDGGPSQWMHTCNRARCLKRAASALKRKSAQELGNRSHPAKKPRPSSVSSPVHMGVKGSGSAASNSTRPTVIVSSASCSAKARPENTGSGCLLQECSSDRSFTNNSRNQDNSIDNLAGNTPAMFQREQNHTAVVSPCTKESKQTTASEESNPIPRIRKTPEVHTVSMSGSEKPTQVHEEVEDHRATSANTVDHIILHQPEIHLDRATAAGQESSGLGTLTVSMEPDGASIALSSTTIHGQNESETVQADSSSPDAERSSFKLKMNFTGPVYITGKMVQMSAVGCQHTVSSNSSTASIASCSKTFPVGSNAASLPSCFSSGAVSASFLGSSSLSINATRGSCIGMDASCQTPCFHSPAVSSRNRRSTSSICSPTASSRRVHSATYSPCSRNGVPRFRQSAICPSTESAGTKSSTSSRATACLEKVLCSVAATTISSSQASTTTGSRVLDLCSQSIPTELAWVKDGTKIDQRQARERRKCESNISAAKKDDGTNREMTSSSGGNPASSSGLHLKTPVLQALLTSSSPSLPMPIQPPLSRTALCSGMALARQSPSIQSKTSADVEYASIAQKKGFMYSQGYEGKRAHEKTRQNVPPAGRCTSMMPASLSNGLGKLHSCISPCGRGRNGEKSTSKKSDAADLAPVEGYEETTTACVGPCSFLTGPVEMLAHSPRHQPGSLQRDGGTVELGGSTSCLSGGLMFGEDHPAVSLHPFPSVTPREKNTATAGRTSEPGKESRRLQEVAQALIDMSSATLP